VIKNKNRGGFIDRQRKGVGMGEEENRRRNSCLFFFLAHALTDVFERTKKKNKVTSAHKLAMDNAQVKKLPEMMLKTK